MRTASTDVRVEMLSAMARALSSYGEDADDMERDLTECAERLGLDAQFYVTPTTVMASFGSDAQESTVLLRVSEGHIDLQALTLVHAVVEGVKAGERTAPQALAELNLIGASPPRFGWWVQVLASGIGAASFSVFLGGDWRSFFAALPVGLAVGALVAIATRHERLRNVMELLGGIIAAVATIAIWHLAPHFTLSTVALAGLILLLPGLAITIGVSELASRHLTSGTARLAGAAVTLINLSLGSYLGFAILDKLDWVPSTAAATVKSEQTTVLMMAVAVLVNSVALLVFSNARTRDWPIVLGAVLLALVGSRLGAWLVGASLGVAVASLVLGLGANTFARLTRRPSMVMLIPGLSVLVPGALGLKGVSEFLSSASGGIDVLINVLVIAAGLVVGLLIADAALPPRAGVVDLEQTQDQS